MIFDFLETLFVVVLSFAPSHLPAWGKHKWYKVALDSVA